MRAETDAESNPVKKPITFGRIMLYAVGLSTSSFFLYNFHKAGYNLHKTEILIGRQLAKLPFYYPPGPPPSERNAALPITSELSSSLIDQVSAWFIHQDSVLKDGLTRSDILDLFSDKFGLVDNEGSESRFQDENLRNALKKVVDQFIENGKGRLTEYKRQSGVSLQETLKLLNDLVRIHKDHSPDSDSLSDKISSVLHEELGRIVESTMAPVSAPALPDVEDVNEREVLIMELSQLERTRDEILNNRPESSLSEAERERLMSINNQIKEVQKLIESC